MEIIDAHAHIYPPKIAEKATTAIGDFYDIKMQMPAGTADMLIENGKKVKTSKYIVHSCATKASQVRSINEFINKEKKEHKEFIGFMTLHQDMTEKEVEEELNYGISSGFYGIKLHPDFQKFYIDGENVQKIYEKLQDLNKTFPILFHTGDNRYDFSKPIRLFNMAKKYDKVKFIGAHFGGYRCWEEVDVYKGLENVYFDTSSSLNFIDKNKAVKIIKKLGAERFFYGTDFPMWDAVSELERFMALDLSSKQKQDILANNIKNLLSIK